jgi:hypothetical protein
MAAGRAHNGGCLLPRLTSQSPQKLLVGLIGVKPYAEIAGCVGIFPHIPLSFA